MAASIRSHIAIMCSRSRPWGKNGSCSIGSLLCISFNSSYLFHSFCRDCYVAVAGLPDPCEDHAVSVARFARDCLKKMKEITLKLEVTLGPDTADLELRVGIHR